MAGALTAAIAAIFSGSAVSTDPYYEYTTLLLPGTGTNGAQNNTFLDGSTNNFTITRNGNTTQGTFSPFSQTGWGNYTAGSINGASRIDVAGTSGLFGTNVSYTIEGWFNFTTPSVTDNTNIIATNTNTYPSRWIIDANVTSSLINLRIITESNAVLYSGSTVSYSLGSWVHLAIVNDNTANTLTFYINGQAAGSRAKVSLGSYATLNLLYQYGVASAVPFYVSNFRITNGQALYTGNFTPSTVPLTTTSQGATAGNVALLTFQSNRFVDNSSSPKTLTVNGTNSIQAFSPFNPTAAWSAATYGGSGYFDGNGDYLSTADNAAFTMGSGDFTIEYWTYFLGGSDLRVYGQFSSSAVLSTISFFGGNSSGNKVLNGVYSGSTGYTCTSTADIPTNQWVHIAFVRDGNTLRQYINGNQDGTSNVTGVSINDSSTQLSVGRVGEYAAQYWNGYISNFRIVKGTCVYPNGTAFTVPTAPLTAITNTSLLLNFTNAGVYDATSKAVLETVNSSSISNAITPKWGSTSIKFASSTSDYLWTNNQTAQVQTFGTGDFTIEGWVYLSTINTAFGIISRGTSTTGWSVNITSGNKLQFSYTTSTLTGATSLVQNTWYYFAVVRSGSASGNLKLYLATSGAISSADATSAGAVTDNFNQINALYVGADRVGTSLLNGYLQDIRMTNYARAITATPTAAFPLQ